MHASWRQPHPQATPRFYLAAVEAARSYIYGEKTWEWPGDEARKGRNKEMGKWEEGTLDFTQQTS